MFPLKNLPRKELMTDIRTRTKQSTTNLWSYFMEYNLYAANKLLLNSDFISQIVIRRQPINLPPSASWACNGPTEQSNCCPSSPLPTLYIECAVW